MRYVFLFLMAGFSCLSSTVTGPISDLAGLGFNPRVEFWPLSTPYNSGNTNVVGPMKSVQAISGNFSQVLLAGTYRVKFPPTTNSFIIIVPNDSATYSLSTLSSNVASVSSITSTYFITSNQFRSALTNNDTRAVTFDTSLTIGAGSAANSIHPSAGLITFSNSILANGSYIKGHSIIGTNFVGNGASLTNLHGSNSITAGTIDTNRMDATAYVAFNNDVTQAGLAAGSYVLAAGAWLINENSRIFYPSFTNAVLAASAYNTVELEAGQHYVTNRISPPIGLRILGNGAGSVIVNAYTNASGTGPAIIPLRHNMIIENIGCSNFYPNSYQSFIGATTTMGDQPFTNVLIRNVSGSYGVDWYMNVHTNNCSIRFENVNMRTQWDVILIGMTGAYSTNTFLNCTFICTGPNSVNPGAQAKALALTSGAIINAYNSSFIGIQDGGFGVGTGSSDNICNFYNCTVAGIGSGAYDVYNGAGSSITFFGTYPSMLKCFGTGGALGVPPFDAYVVGQLLSVQTNIAAAPGQSLTLSSQVSEFEVYDTVMSTTGGWVFPNKISVSGTTATFTSGTGAPSAGEPNGSVYLRTDGAASTTLYIRHTGAWLAK